MPSKSIGLRIDSVLYEQLIKRANKEHRTLSNMIISLIMDSQSIPSGKKRPVYVKGEISGIPRPACPNCLTLVYRVYDDGIPADFCPYCGQHLEWDESVDKLCFPNKYL